MNKKSVLFFCIIKIKAVCNTAPLFSLVLLYAISNLFFHFLFFFYCRESCFTKRKEKKRSFEDIKISA